MSKHMLPKEEIDETNPLLDGTMFQLAKRSEVGSGREVLELSDDEYITYQLLSGGFNSKIASDLCLVDHDKMMLIYCIHIYQLGTDYTTVFQLIKDNKYCYLFLETVLKDIPFTKEIVEGFCDIFPIDYQPIIDCNGDTALMWACSNSMNSVAIKLINTFGEVVKPDQVNKNGSTTLILACSHCMNSVAIKLIDTFGEVVKDRKSVV